jgi:hypothetical protein
MYINTETMQYPLTVNQIKAMTPNTSFPDNYAPSAPYEPVLQSPQPTYNTMTQYCREVTPVLINGVWMQAWEVVDLDPEQIAYNEEQAKQANKTQAESLLQQTDWTATVDINNPEYSNPYLGNQPEFLAYRSAIRKIAVNPPVVVESWAIKPTELWITVE